MIAKNDIPNYLTFSRIAIIPLFILAFYLPASWGIGWLAIGCFVYASITDFFDGYLARLWQVESDIGQLLDPIADKLLVATALVLLAAAYPLLALPAIIILCREIFIAGLREYMSGKDVTIHVSALAKWKTALQMAALCLLLVAHGANSSWLLWPGIFALYGAAALTAYTGWEYLRDALLRS